MSINSLNLIYSRNDEMPLEECEGASQEHQNHKYYGIATEILKDRARHFMIFNDLNFLEEIKDREFVITSPITYIGSEVIKYREKFLTPFKNDFVRSFFMEYKKDKDFYIKTLSVYFFNSKNSIKF